MVRFRKIINVGFLFFVAFIMATPVLVKADDSSIVEMQTGLDTAKNVGIGTAKVAQMNAEQLVSFAISTVLGLVGTAFFLTMLYGGILWMLDSGDEANVKKAQKLIKNAVYGMIIISMAYVFTSFLGGLLF